MTGPICLPVFRVLMTCGWTADDPTRRHTMSLGTRGSLRSVALLFTWMLLACGDGIPQTVDAVSAQSELTAEVSRGGPNQFTFALASK